MCDLCNMAADPDGPMVCGECGGDYEPCDRCGGGVCFPCGGSCFWCATGLGPASDLGPATEEEQALLNWRE